MILTPAWFAHGAGPRFCPDRSPAKLSQRVYEALLSVGPQPSNWQVNAIESASKAAYCN